MGRGKGAEPARGARPGRVGAPSGRPPRLVAAPLAASPFGRRPLGRLTDRRFQSHSGSAAAPRQNASSTVAASETAW